MKAAVLAVDGGNSKTDVAIVAEDGRVLGAVRGPTTSHQQVGLERGVAEMGRLVSQAAHQAGVPDGRAVADLGVYCLAGADFRQDMNLLRDGLKGRFASQDLIFNDTFAALRAGAEKGWGVVLICGQGINAAAMAPDGRTARFAAIGTLSGDWGGGGSLGTGALAAAIRAGDGRGPRTSLRRSVAAHFGMRTAEAVMVAMYDERLPSNRLNELAPVVFRDAAAGDAVARGIVDMLADELAVMAIALMRRLKLVREEVDVVLAGGVFKTTEQGFYDRLRERIERVAPRARLVRLAAPPVAGAALLGLDRLSREGRAAPDVTARLRRGMSDWQPS